MDGFVQALEGVQEALGFLVRKGGRGMLERFMKKRGRRGSLGEWGGGILQRLMKWQRRGDYWGRLKGEVGGAATEGRAT